MTVTNGAGVLHSGYRDFFSGERGDPIGDLIKQQGLSSEQIADASPVSVDLDVVIQDPDLQGVVDDGMGLSSHLIEIITDVIYKAQQLTLSHIPGEGPQEIINSINNQIQIVANDGRYDEVSLASSVLFTAIGGALWFTRAKIQKMVK